MKKYHRESKSWIDAEDHDRKTKKRKLCKGGREHEWMLCLPSYIKHEDSEFGFSIAEKYYKLEDAREDYDMAYNEKLALIGINSRRFSLSRMFGRRRSYVCTECMKRK